jgi:hypothetical protein
MFAGDKCAGLLKRSNDRIISSPAFARKSGRCCSGGIGYGHFNAPVLLTMKIRNIIIFFDIAGNHLTMPRTPMTMRKWR